MIIDINMPSAILLNRVDNSDRIEGFDDNNCHVGTGYVKANRALMDIDNERQRQISKGYDDAHDDADNEGNHARAAAYYATAAYYQRQCGYVDSDDPDEFDRLNCELKSVMWVADEDSVGYPWPSKTKDVEYSPRANLVKAAALLVAEIERIDREEVA